MSEKDNWAASPGDASWEAGGGEEQADVTAHSAAADSACWQAWDGEEQADASWEAWDGKES